VLGATAVDRVAVTNANRWRNDSTETESFQGVMSRSDGPGGRQCQLVGNVKMKVGDIRSNRHRGRQHEALRVETTTVCGGYKRVAAVGGEHGADVMPRFARREHAVVHNVAPVTASHCFTARRRRPAEERVAISRVAASCHRCENSVRAGWGYSTADQRYPPQNGDRMVPRMKRGQRPTKKQKKKTKKKKKKKTKKKINPKKKKKM